MIAGLGLGPEDEIVTTDQEHPGLLGPLLAARRRGVTVRAVPFAHVAEAVLGQTTTMRISSISVFVMIASPAIAPPSPSEPVSPMKIVAGNALNQRKPTQAPTRQPASSARSCWPVVMNVMPM